jgi:hypothetical protein
MGERDAERSEVFMKWLIGQFFVCIEEVSIIIGSGCAL